METAVAATEGAAKPSDDYALMRAIAQRNPAALGMLYDRHASSLLPLCMRILHDWMEAQDVLTEIFWEVWNRAERYDPARGAPMTYLLTLARSRAIDRRRSGKRRSGEQLDGSARDRATGGGPVREVMAQELRGRIVAAMARLDPAQREAVELSFFDNLSHSQIAEQLARPLGTVKTHIRQGLICLRDFLRMHDGGGR